MDGTVKSAKFGKVLVALVLGSFCVVAPATAGAEPAVRPSVQRGWENLGGVNLHAYCGSEGYNGTALRSPDVFGWVCVSADDERRITMYLACAWQYDRFDVIAAYGSFHNPYSWSCHAFQPR